MLVEVLLHITRLGAEKGHGSGPRLWVRPLLFDIIRDLPSGEEPHLDAFAVPKMHKYTTRVIVEWRSVAANIGIAEPAASVVAGRTRTLVVYDVRLHLDPILRETASFTGVEHVLIGGLLMNTFQDVDLPTLRPIRSDRPVCWPDAAAMGHLPEVRDEEPTVVFLLGTDSYPVALQHHACQEIEWNKLTSHGSLQLVRP